METKERILKKAHDLFNRFGIRSVSMDEIAAQLGMSKKTVYQYFADKDELVDAVFTAMMDQNRECCIADVKEAGNAVQEVLLAFNRVQEMFATIHPSVLFDLEKYHSATFQKFKEFQNGFLYQQITTNLKRGIQEGLYRENLDIDVLSRFRIYSIMLSFNPEVFPNNRNNLLHIEQQLLEHFLYGIATPKGQKLLQKYPITQQKLKSHHE